MDNDFTLAARANRAVNFYLVAMLSVAGAAALPGLRAHRDAGGKVDDSLLVITALVALTWYIGMGNRFANRITPFLLVAVATVVKIAGIVTRDAVSRTPDVALALFLGAALLIATGWRLTLRGVGAA